jgi:uncharacterized membrane protein
MSWLSIVGFVLILIAAVSVIGFKPKGGRPVERTRLMGMARIALVVFALVLVWMGFQG